MALIRFNPKLKSKTENNRDMQTLPTFAIVGGMKMSIPPNELESMYCSLANNILFDKNKIKQRGGYVVYGTTTPLSGDAILNITEFVGYDGIKYICAFTKKNAYLYDGASYWNPITEQITISDCQSAWTASANVVSTADSTIARVGTKSAKHVIDAAFTTGLASYIDISSKDLTGYTHLYFYIRSSVVLATPNARCSNLCSSWA